MQRISSEVYHVNWRQRVDGRQNWRQRTERVVEYQPNTVSVDLYEVLERQLTRLHHDINQSKFLKWSKYYRSSFCFIQPMFCD